MTHANRERAVDLMRSERESSARIPNVELRAEEAEAFQFGRFRLDVGRWELRRVGVLVHLEPAAFKLLTYLVQHRDRVVPKCELMEMLWPEQVVSEGVLPQCVFVVRHALDDDGQAQRVLRTYRGRGYRFVAAVEEVASTATEPDHPRALPKRDREADACHSCGRTGHHGRATLDLDISTCAGPAAPLPRWLEALVGEIRERLATGSITPEEVAARLGSPGPRANGRATSRTPRG